MAAAATAVAAIVLTAVVIVAQSRSSNDDDSASRSASTTTTAAAGGAWSRQAATAFGPLVDAVPKLVNDARRWVGGELSADDFRTRVEATTTAFASARTRVDKLPPSPGDPQTLALYRVSARLYEQTVAIYLGALDAPAGDVRTQLDLLARRVREVADRTFDAGHELLGPNADPSAVDVRRPEEVPMWVAEGLAAGPPLDAVPPPPAQFPPLREESRPETSRESWVAAVAAAGAPSGTEVRIALDAGGTDRLADVARRLVDASERLRSQPDPLNGRIESVRARLVLLVYADAARAAQAGILTGETAHDRLRAVAGELQSAGDELWSKLLPPR